METGKFNKQRNPKLVTTCANCAASFHGYRRDKKTCSLRCRKQLKVRTQQQLTSEKLTADIRELNQTYRFEQDLKANKIIY